MSIDLIITKSSLLLSNKSKDWREWQDEYADYMASISFQNKEALLAYLKFDYNLSDNFMKVFTFQLEQNDKGIMEIKLPQGNHLP